MKQQGFANVTLVLYLASAVAVGLLIWSAYLWVDHTWQTSAGVKKGAADKDAEYIKRDASAIKAANVKIQELQTAARAKERESAENISAISTTYEKQVRDAKIRSDDLARRVAAGNIRLYDTGSKCPAASGNGGMPQTSASPSERDGAAGAQLSDAVAQFLISEAGRADGIVAQLTACQSIVAADRR